MLLGLAALLVLVVLLQWFTEEITWKFLGVFPISFQRDEHPVFFWTCILGECALSGFLVYCWS